MRDLKQDQSPQETYLHNLFPQEPSELFERAREESVRLNKAAISLSPAEARLMATLIESHGCKKFVEIGTLTGASALWILHGMGPKGHLWTFEKDPEHAKSAKKTLKSFKNVQVIEGDAEVTLKTIEDKGLFDGIFIDGNKSAYGRYLDWAEAQLKKGALIIADNVFLGGSVFTGNTARFSKKQIEIMRQFNKRLADPDKYTSAIVPTGEGLFIAIKK